MGDVIVEVCDDVEGFGCLEVFWVLKLSRGGVFGVIKLLKNGLYVGLKVWFVDGGILYWFCVVCWLFIVLKCKDGLINNVFWLMRFKNMWLVRIFWKFLLL